MSKRPPNICNDTRATSKEVLLLSSPATAASIANNVVDTNRISSVSSQHDDDPSQTLSHQSNTQCDDNPSVAATFKGSSRYRRPHLSPCSLKCSTWSRQRIRTAACRCLSSAIICTVRLILNPGPSAYLIHSIIVLFDMLLIHIFANTPWLSFGGEITAIIFATIFHFTNQKIFELLETTIIAALVSIHMIQSRDEHWDREDHLEKDVIGLQLYIEHHAINHTTDADIEIGNRGRRRSLTLNDKKGSISRRRSSISKLDANDNQSSRSTIRRSSLLNNAGSFVENDNEENEDSNIPCDISTFASSRRSRMNVEGERSKASTCWHHFFEHFLDGSAGVLYTSFVGLIIDEIVNLYWLEGDKK